MVKARKRVVRKEPDSEKDPLGWYAWSMGISRKEAERRMERMQPLVQTIQRRIAAREELQTRRRKPGESVH